MINRHKNRYAYAVMIVFIAIMISACSPIKSSETAIAGHLDLSHWDFIHDGSVNLEGEWLLYPNVFMDATLLDAAEKDAISQYFKVPQTYRQTVSGMALPKEGYGTLALKVKVPRKGQYAVMIRQIMSASKIWINGELVSSAGSVGQDPLTAKGSFERQFFQFNCQEDEFDIVIHMSNFNNVRGRIRPIVLGDAQIIKRQYIRGIASDIFIAGALFIMAIYHFALYYKRKDNKKPLYFACFCMTICLRNALVGSRLIYELYPNLNFSVFNRLAYLTVYGSLPFLVLFFKEMFNSPLFAHIGKFIIGISLLFSSLTLFLPIHIYDSFLIYFELTILIFFVYLMVIVAKAVRSRQKGAVIILWGLVIFLMSVINDILVQNGILNTRSLASYGFFIFIFFQSYVLAAQFSDAYVKIESLLEENKKLYFDALTGVLNRRGFYDKGEALFNSASETGQSFIIFYGDLNGLKCINDQYGHRAGDEAIMATASLMQASFSEDDLVARMSGDEFIAIAVDTSTKERAQEIMAKIHKRFKDYNQQHHYPFELSISLGYAIYRQNKDISFDRLVQKADAMLYENKMLFKSSQV